MNYTEGLTVSICKYLSNVHLHPQPRILFAVMLSLKDFYTTNRAPNDEEKGTIKQFVAKYDDKLATISNKIRDLEAQLRALNHEKVALHSSMPFCHSANFQRTLFARSSLHVYRQDETPLCQTQKRRSS